MADFPHRSVPMEAPVTWREFQQVIDILKGVITASGVSSSADATLATAFDDTISPDAVTLAASSTGTATAPSRADHHHPLSQAIAPTWTETHNTSSLLPRTAFTYDLGSLSMKYRQLFAAELWVETLVAQNTMATIGGRILVGPTTYLASDLTAVATSISVQHNNLASGDRIYLEANGKVEFMSVDSAATGAGPYSYTVTRDLDGTGANVWNAGDAVANTGTTGDGFIDIYSVSGVNAGTTAGPTIVGNVRNSATYSDWSPMWAIGNLKNMYGMGSSDIYGAAFGKYANSESFLTVDATNGIRILKRAADANTVIGQWDTSGNILIGQAAASQSNVYITAGAIALRNNTTTRINLAADGSGYLANSSISWDTSGNLTVAGNASIAGWTVTSDAISNAGPTLTMRSAGNIALGATPPTSATVGTGIYLDSTGLYGLAADVQQAYISATDGKVYAGAGNVYLDVNGIGLISGTGTPNKVTWYKTGTSSAVGQVHVGYVAASQVNGQFALFGLNVADDALLELLVNANTGAGAVQGTISIFQHASLAANSYIYFGLNGTELARLTTTGLALQNGLAITFDGATSGTATLLATAIAGTPTLSLPTTTGTLALRQDKLSVFAATTSAELLGIISDETGSGALMFATSPTITTSLLIADGAYIGQAAGPQVLFDDSNNILQITGGRATLTVSDGAAADYNLLTATLTRSASGAYTARASTFTATATHTTGTLTGTQSVSASCTFTGNGGTTTNSEIVSASATVGAGATVANLKMFHIYTPTIGAGPPAGAITNLTGLYIENMTGGGTSNYSIYSAGGSMYHAGNITVGNGAYIGQAAGPQVLFDDTGNTLQVSGCFALINDTSNANMTVGWTINQGAADDQILALKSSDVAHGMTTIVETDTYTEFLKAAAATGGVVMRGFSAGSGAMYLMGYHTTDDTAKTTAAQAAVVLRGGLKSGTSADVCGADANLVAIQNYGTTRFIFDAEGSAHADVAWTTFDSFDDLALLDSLEAHLDKSNPGHLPQYDRNALQRAGIVNFYDPSGQRAMLNTTRLSMLHTGAIRQLAQRQVSTAAYREEIRGLQARIEALEARPNVV